MAYENTLGLPERIPEVQLALTKLLKSVDSDEHDKLSQEPIMIKARADIRRATRELIGCLGQYTQARFKEC